MLTLSLLLAVAVQATPATPPPALGARTISGIVLDEHGAPLAGALVQWQPPYRDAEPVAETTSRADGRFELPVEPEIGLDRLFPRGLSITFPGLAPTLIDQVPCSERDYDFGPLHVYPFAELHGRVTTFDGAPIAGALIYANSTEPSTVATTGDDGLFACRNVPSGLVEFGVSAPGFADLDLGFRKLSLRSPNELNAKLLPGRSVTLQVRSRKTGAPLVATGVICPSFHWEPWGTTGRDAAPYSGRSIHALWRDKYVGDVEGRLTIEGVAIASEYREVFVSAPGHQGRYVSLSDADVAVALEPALMIDVHVRRQATSVSPEIARWAILQSRGREYLSSDGPAVQRVAPDRWRIECSDISGRDTLTSLVGLGVELVDGARAYKAFDAPNEAGEFAVEFEFPPTTRSSGRVVSIEGQPVRLRLALAHADLSMPNDGMHGYRPVFSVAPGGWDLPRFRFDTGDDGRFVLDSAGVSRGRFELVTPGWEFVGDPAEFIAGVDVDVDRVLTVRRVARTDVIVRGVVRVGGAAPGLPLQLAFGPSGPAAWNHVWESPTLTWTDRDGRFEAFLPSSGPYTIRAQNPKPPEASLRSLVTEFLTLDLASPKSIEVAGPLMEGVQVDLPPFEEWTAEPLKHR